MSSKFSKIYLALAPVLFVLSWYIAHRIYVHFLQGNSDFAYVKDRSIIYASVFTTLYLVTFFVIRDLYRPKQS